MAEPLAAISPMAGAGGGGVDRLIETKTPIFIYHSSDDFIAVDPDRQAAKRLKDSDLDFVYTELDGKGHGFPDSVQVELFDFFGPRRNYDPAYKEAWPRSSLLAKTTKEEKTYLGDPMDEASGAPADLDLWCSCLRVGGGRALAAARIVAERKPEGAAEAVAKVLRDPKTPFQARAFAARALGLLGDATAAPSLRKAVSADAAKEQSLVAVESARALVALADPEGGPPLARAVETWTRYYEDKSGGADVHFSDWTRSLSTLAALVEAWGTLATDNPSLLARTVVARVLAPQHKVQTSDRVPQDPSEARTALARAVGTAFRLRKATDDQWSALLDALSNDAKARAAAEAARTPPPG
jgi:hypothetical protein